MSAAPNMDKDTLVDNLIKEIEKTTKKDFILLGNIDVVDKYISAITTDFISSHKHIILPKMVTKPAFTLQRKCFRLVGNWPYGGTSMGNALWVDYMFPELDKAKNFLSQKKYKKAFGILLGIFLFSRVDSYFMHDNEVYLEFSTFSGWFSDYSKAWKKLLKQSDKVLGLDCKHINPEGYREVLVAMITKWEKKSNRFLKDFNRFADDDILPRFRIFTTEDDDDAEEEEDSSDEEE